MKTTIQRQKRRLLWSPRLAPLALIVGISLLIGAGTVLSLSSSSREVGDAGEQLFAGNLQGMPQSVTGTLYLPFIAKDFCPAALERMPFGVQILAEVDNPTAITLAGEAGAHWVRTSLSWSRIEPVSTTVEYFDWTLYDQRFANLAAAGLNPIVTIGDNPTTWAAEYPCGPITDTNLADFAEFLSAVVNRYKDPPYNVKYWELYNEPDNGDPINYGWLGGCWGHYGEEYAAMLKVAYPAVKAADPEAKVVFGGLAYDWFEDEGGPFVHSFIEDVLSNEGGNYFDIMNFHYYPAFAYRWEELYNCAGVRGKDVICKVAYLGGKLATYEVDKPFVCTEINQWSGEEYGGSDEKQSAYVVQSMARGASVDLQAIIWFTLVDFEEKWKYGLLNPNYSPKPAYLAYQTLAEELAGAWYIRRLPDEETGAVEIEAYEFTVPCPDRLLWVVWTNGDTRRKMDFPVNKLRLVDKYGGETIVSDGQAEDLDGVVNGKVRIWINPSDPIYASE
jgi:hypothetical protein